MGRRPPRATVTDTLCPYPTLCRALMPGHIRLDPAIGQPVECGCWISRPDRRAVHQLAADRRRGRAGFGKPPLRIGEPWPRVDRVAQFLVGQLFARDVDDPEPVELFVLAALADIDRQLIIEDLPLPVRSEEHTSELQYIMRISYAVF